MGTTLPFCVQKASLICKKTYKHEVENLDDFVRGEQEVGRQSVSH